MQIFIDESGNLGKQGRFFVITCLIPKNPNRLKNLVKKCRVIFGENGIPLKELKGFNLDFLQKQYFVNRLISTNDFEFAYIVADKYHLDQNLITKKNICFNYLTAHLLKSIVKSSDEDIQIICDNRDVKVSSGRALEEYLQIEAYAKWGFKHQITLQYENSTNVNHLQCVDVISNIISGRYFLNLGHFYRLLQRNRRHYIRFPYHNFGQERCG